MGMAYTEAIQALQRALKGNTWRLVCKSMGYSAGEYAERSPACEHGVIFKGGVIGDFSIFDLHIR